MPYVHVKLKESNQSTVTDKNGFFSFRISKKIGSLHLHIKSLGIDTSVAVLNKNQTEKIYVAPSSFALTDVVIKGLTAKQVVEEAIRRIPENYADSTYAYYSFYREYQKVNEQFKNLIEAKAVAMIKPFMEKRRLTAEEAFAIKAMRRSNFYWDIDDMKVREGFEELLKENPIYYMTRSSFMPFIFERCIFHFDSLSTAEDYIINYSCPNSSDNHGFENAAHKFFGESYETGTFIIERSSFAFRRIERNSFRNKRYNYPRYNNFLIPSRNYTIEFAGGSFIVEYASINHKWFLKTLLYSYTNDFFLTKIYRKDYSITENFEWYVDSVSRYISEDLRNQFYKGAYLVSRNYNYDSTAWDSTPPFYFYPKEEIYDDIGSFILKSNKE